MRGQLELPDARQFMTRMAAAQALNCSERTVTRMVGEGKLHPQYPRRGKDPGGRTERGPLLFAVSEIEEMARARALVKGEADG